ncbi:MAG TPA: class I SAM-dependent methyltransferase [Methanospirillum sp.]|nr:class I SAM-dependent methyltransferase [Methanospirillum sp.]
MIPNENVTCWLDCWKSSLQETDIITDEMQAIRWNRRADSFAKDMDEERKQKKTADFFNLLDEAGFQPSGATVLDIGCGTGSLSIPLAQAGAEVTSLDISSAMLDRLMEVAEHEGLHITPIECSWWTADIDKLGFRNRFDLVIASMTPSIKDVETFNRMMACSKKYCYYSNFIRKNPDKIPRDVYVKILGKAPQSDTFAAGLLYPFMYLYTLGFHPIIKLYHKSVRREQDWSESAEKAIDFLLLSQPLSDEKKEQIREYYKNSSTDGRYNADYEKYSGMLIWPVDTPVR